MKNTISHSQNKKTIKSHWNSYHYVTRILVVVALLIVAGVSCMLFANYGVVFATSSSTTEDNHLYLPIISSSPPNNEWPMVAANPQRTSWTSEEVSGNLLVEWYRPIEAYISQNVQLIASHGLIYIATARGLYALNANTGDLAWRYDTDIPLGHSPTVSENVLYVGGFDKKLHVMDARNGSYLWSFDGAKAGYSTNPIVIDGKVIIANRDGGLYAIGAHGTPTQGNLIWKFQSGGSINLSPAYKDGVVYFAANDNHAYAVSVSDGSLVWKSHKLPGDGFNSYWPVIFKDKVIFSAASGYKTGSNPGTMSVSDPDGESYGQHYYMDRDEIFDNSPYGTLVGAQVSDRNWSGGYPVYEMSNISQYLEKKPWRRTVILLNQIDGTEFTFDSDLDGNQKYIPVAMWGTQSGNRYPPIIDPNGILYVGNVFQHFFISQGRVMGWNPDEPEYMSVLSGGGAVDEPQALSIGGNIVYRNICCDRVGDYFNLQRGAGTGTLWTYHTPLSQIAPNYDQMWWGMDPNDPVRLHGNYRNENGIYHNHGDQNPIIPYNGMLFTHRSNAVVAFSPGGVATQKPLLTIQPGETTVQSPPTSELTSRLENEIQKMIDAGLLRPGYYNAGQFMYRDMGDYFSNPGDTLYTLSMAYPHLSSGLQNQLKTYLQTFFNAYFNPTMIARIGWAEGAPRESLLLPLEVEAALIDFPDSLQAHPQWSWQYPQINFYGMWKYAEIFPEDAPLVYDLAKSKVQAPVPPHADETFFDQRPWELNGYIGGYHGFLRLQELAGMDGQDVNLRITVQNELNRLLQMRANNFTKDTPWIDEQYHFRIFNISRNFTMLTPELGEYLRTHALNKVENAIHEYNDVGPYWFVSRYNAVVNEGAMQNLYDYHGMFLAKAYILEKDRDELYAYLDVPAFDRGDLFYIQNLVALLNTNNGPIGVNDNCLKSSSGNYANPFPDQDRFRMELYLTIGAP
jgi:hypothetical protein